MLQLREYQIQLIDKVNSELEGGKTRLIVQAPTGSGKTVILSSMCLEYIKQGKNVMVMTDRIELYNQTKATLEKTGIEVFDLNSLPDYQTQIIDIQQPNRLVIAMVETLSRRLRNDMYKVYLQDVDVLVIDEAHMTAFHKVSKHLRADTIVLGFTATPIRTGAMVSLRAEGYQEIVSSVSTYNLITKGNLVQPIYYTDKRLDTKKLTISQGDFDLNSQAKELSGSKVYDGVIENYKRYAKDTKALLFAPTLEATAEVHEAIEKSGIPTRYLDSYFSPEQRAETLRWFKETKSGILCNCGILTKGFDQPDIKTVILYRATKSYALFNQMVGRGSRPAKGKDKLVVLDFGGNIERHGFWESPRKWSLDKKTKKEVDKEQKERNFKVCPQCKCLCSPNASKCKNCGYNFFEAEQKEVERVMLIRQQADKKAMEEYAERERLAEINRHARRIQFAQPTGITSQSTPIVISLIAKIETIPDKDDKKEQAKAIAKMGGCGFEDKLNLVNKQYLTDYSMVFYLKSKEEFDLYKQRRKLDENFLIKLNSFFQRVDNYPRYWDKVQKQ